MNWCRIGLALAGAAAFAAPPAIGQVAPPPATLSIGQAIAGELSPNDAQRRSGKYEDVYADPGPARRSVRIDLGSLRISTPIWW